MRRFAPSVVITLAACSGRPPATPQPPEERSWTEFRDGVCEVMPDCTPPPGERYNPCNPPPPRVTVDCPAALLPTQPPDTTLAVHDDGTCWVDCDDTTCDGPGALRVACPADGAAPPTYDANVVVPAEREVRAHDYVITRRDDLHCDMVQHGTPFPDVACPEPIAPHVAPGVVPVISSTHMSICYYGNHVVACPARFHVWH